MNENVVQAILSYGDRYCKEIQNQYNKDYLKENWWEALKFFFGRAFYQGRQEGMSEKVDKAAVDVLEIEVSILKTCFENKNWELLKEKLKEKIGRGKVGKARDVEMVISTLKYVSRLPNRNMIVHSVERINSGKIEDHYKELQYQYNQANGIFQVGPKIASLYLRDVVSLFQLEDKLSDYDYIYLQPIDTSVRKVAIKMGLVTNAETDVNDDEIRVNIVKLCQKFRCSPLQFNHGAWYTGNYAFDLLFENLAKQRV